MRGGAMIDCHSGSAMLYSATIHRETDPMLMTQELNPQQQEAVEHLNPSRVRRPLALSFTPFAFTAIAFTPFAFTALAFTALAFTPFAFVALAFAALPFTVAPFGTFAFVCVAVRAV